jgi:23S rRNA pseudouridine1911/1915/1917 synthase
VHRLDIPTSGIVIFARTTKAIVRLSAMFRNKKIKKTYWAVVGKLPDTPKGTLRNFLNKNPKNNRSTAFATPVEGSKEAILHYQVIKSLDRYHLLHIDLETGRHHQIRCQLAAIGSPIKGDLKYGFDRSNKDGGIHLHARQVQFTHPVSKLQIDITAPLPQDPVWSACRK